MKTWSYRTFSQDRRITAARMTFEHGHVAWWDAAGELVYAERNDNVAGLMCHEADGTVGYKDDPTASRNGRIEAS